jgi:acyl carrier protein
MAGRLSDTDRQRMAAAGVTPIDEADGWRALARLLERGTTHACVMAADWSTLADRFDARATPSIFREIRAAAPAVASRARGLLEEIAALPPCDRHGALVRQLQTRVAAILGAPDSESIRPTQGFFALGMDSLTSVELRNQLAKELSCTLAPTVAFDYGTTDALAAYLLSQVPQWTIPVEPAAAAVEDFDAYSEGELAAMLAQELNQGETRG